MRRTCVRSGLWGAGLCLLLTDGTDARGPAPRVTAPLSPAESRLLHDPPRAHLDALARTHVDTTWFGGVDGNGHAVEGGVWDFEDGSLQGWTSEDLTDMPLYARRVTRAESDAHGNPVQPVINGEASAWIGTHQDEAEALCWPGGQGYGNWWIQGLRKTFDYAGSGTVTVSFDYFVDSETQFDYTYVYTEVDGVLSTPLNTSMWSSPEGWGYSGSVFEGTAIGTPTSPASDAIVIDTGDLPSGAGEFDILFQFRSDLIYSDALDGFDLHLDSDQGAVGVDDINVVGVSLGDFADFETDADGWAFEQAPPVGAFLAASDLADLDPIVDDCDCDVAGTVMTFADLDPDASTPHPDRQLERTLSPPIHVGIGSGVSDRTRRALRWDTWEDLSSTYGVYYSIGLSYYPWACPETGESGWSPGPFTIFLGALAACRSYMLDVTTMAPESVDSLRVGITLLTHCDPVWSFCVDPEERNPSPYLDNVRLGLLEADIEAPGLDHDLTYQDGFPRDDSLVPGATADVHAFLDWNRIDGDPTNANLGDSVVVQSGTAPDTEVYLNFRVYPGPSLDPADPFLTDPRHGGDALAPTWARARMDTAEVMTAVVAGRYSSYFWPDGQENMANGKIIPDGVLTPGTTVEYFFSSAYSSTPSTVRTLPDTVGGFFFEFEILPGYLEVGGEVLTPCVLYVDAYDQGAQQAIESFALRDPTILGTVVDDEGLEHARWDRYDYTAAATNLPAPLAREAAGNNGMTTFQSLLYRHILYNTGTFRNEGLRDGDAELLATWLTTDDFDRWTFEKALWLSGNGIPTILDRPGRVHNNELLAGYVGATVVGGGDAYRDLTDDSSFCVRLDGTSGADFGFSGSYSSVRGNGCPHLLDFQVVSPIADTAGNLAYADQDAGGAVTSFASVARERIPGGTPSDPANHRVVMDAFSLHFLRTTPDGWTGEDCGDDSAAITQRASEVFGWLGVSTDLCAPPVPDLDAGMPGQTPAVTRLHRNSPNPFNPVTTLRYDLARAAYVRLVVHDVAGRRVRTLVDDEQTPSVYRIRWDGRDDHGTEVASGVYWARLTTSHGFGDTTKLVVLK